MIKPLASYGNSSSQPNTNLSTSISLSIVDQNGNTVSPNTTLNNPIEIIIPRDPNLIIPPMILQNVTSLNSTGSNQLFNYHYINITTTISISVHIELHPLNLSLAYLFIYKFDSLPQLNEYDGWTLFCPFNLSNDSIYTYFIDNQQTKNHQSVLFGIHEFNSTDICNNYSLNTPSINSKTINSLPINNIKLNSLINNRKLNFTSDYELRFYTSGCHYLDDNNNWQSDNMLVSKIFSLIL